MLRGVRDCQRLSLVGAIYYQGAKPSLGGKSKRQHRLMRLFRRALGHGLMTKAARQLRRRSRNKLSHCSYVCQHILALLSNPRADLGADGAPITCDSEWKICSSPVWCPLPANPETWDQARLRAPRATAGSALQLGNRKGSQRSRRLSKRASREGGEKCFYLNDSWWKPGMSRDYCIKKGPRTQRRSAAPYLWSGSGS